jgi:hypothetical protein
MLEAVSAMQIGDLPDPIDAPDLGMLSGDLRGGQHNVIEPETTDAEPVALQWHTACALRRLDFDICHARHLPTAIRIVSPLLFAFTVIIAKSS